MAKTFETQCENCNKTFFLQKGQFKAGRFCCVNCFKEWRKHNCNVELVCELCGKSYTRTKSLSHNSRFCSKNCLNNGRNGTIEFNCDYCGKAVKQDKSHYNSQKKHYCSLVCRGKDKIGKCISPNHKRIGDHIFVSFVCSNCGKNAKQKYSNYGKEGLNHFCDKKCEGEWVSQNRFGEKSSQWKGGVTKSRYAIRNSRNYRLWRKKCFEREAYTCEICNINGGYLEVHHVKPFSLICDENNIKSLEEAKTCYELWDTKNGQVLCKACHNSITFNKLNTEIK